MIRLTILNLKKTLFEGNAASITLPGEEGELTILPNHVPLITPLKKGLIHILRMQKEKNGAEERAYVECGNGIFEFANNTATVLL